MKWIDFSVDSKGVKSSYVVEVGKDQWEKFDFPTVDVDGDKRQKFPVRVTAAGDTMLQVPATHLVADERDVVFTEVFVAECEAKFDKHPLDLLNDGALDLASRKIALDQYRIKKGRSNERATELIAANQWAMAEFLAGRQAVMTEYTKMLQQGATAEANVALVKAYNERK